MSTAGGSPLSASQDDIDSWPFSSSCSIRDSSLGDKHNLAADELYNYLTRVLYNRRCKMNPLWLDMVVGGMVVNKAGEKEPFLGHVNFRGRSYETDCIATGFGMHLGLPLLRNFKDSQGVKTKTQAEAEVRKVMEVLFYRDCRSFPKYKIATVTSEGTTVSGTMNVEETWNVANYIKGY